MTERYRLLLGDQEMKLTSMSPFKTIHETHRPQSGYRCQPGKDVASLS